MKYTRDGRSILRDGTPVLYVEREGTVLKPHDATLLVERIVQLLNADEAASPCACEQLARLASLLRDGP